MYVAEITKAVSLWFIGPGFEWVCSLAVAGTLICLVAIAMHWVFVRSSADTRFRIWNSALIGLAILPLLIVTPGVPLGWFDDQAANVDDSPLLDFEFTAMPQETLVAPVDTSGLSGPVAQLSIQKPTNGIFVDEAHSVFWIPNWLTFSTIASVIWMIGMLVQIMFLIRAQYFAAQTKRRSTIMLENSKASLCLDRLVTSICDSQPAPKAGLAVSSSIDVAMTAGIRRPVILLPQSHSDWPDERLQMVLTHELCHLLRRDTLWQVLGRLAVAIHWFNPLVWYSLLQAGLLREKSCDDFVLCAGARPSDYAECLLQFTTNAKYFDGAVAFSDPPIKRRIVSILDPVAPRSTATFKTRIALLCAFAATLFAVGLMRPHHSLSAPPILSLNNVSQSMLQESSTQPEPQAPTSESTQGDDRSNVADPPDYVDAKFTTLAKEILNQFKRNDIQSMISGQRELVDDFQYRFHQRKIATLSEEIRSIQGGINEAISLIARTELALKNGKESVAELAWILRNQKKLLLFDDSIDQETVLQRYLESQHQQLADAKVILQRRSEQYKLCLTNTEQAARANAKIKELQRQHSNVRELLSSTVVRIVKNQKASIDCLKQLKKSFEDDYVAAEAIIQELRLVTDSVAVLKDGSTPLELMLFSSAEQIDSLNSQLEMYSTIENRAELARTRGAKAIEEFVWIQMDRGRISNINPPGLDQDVSFEQKSQVIFRYYLKQLKQQQSDVERQLESANEKHKLARIEYDRTHKARQKLKDMELTRDSLEEPLNLVHKTILARLYLD